MLGDDGGSHDNNGASAAMLLHLSRNTPSTRAKRKKEEGQGGRVVGNDKVCKEVTG
jgi:hypothetical protein